MIKCSESVNSSSDAHDDDDSELKIQSQISESSSDSSFVDRVKVKAAPKKRKVR